MNGSEAAFVEICQQCNEDITFKRLIVLSILLFDWPVTSSHKNRLNVAPNLDFVFKNFNSVRFKKSFKHHNLYFSFIYQLDAPPPMRLIPYPTTLLAPSMATARHCLKQ